MDLDQLKSTWKTLDNKLAATYQINEQMARMLLSDRSRGAIAGIRQNLKQAALFFTALLAGFSFVLLGNPFDYVSWIEFVPGVLYSLLVIIMLFMIAIEYQKMQANELILGSLRESLIQAIYQHEHYRQTMDRVWQISLLIGFLFGISLFARHFTDYGFIKSALLVGGQALMVVFMYLLAKRVLGQSPNRHLNRLKGHLRELDELDAI